MTTSPRSCVWLVTHAISAPGPATIGAVAANEPVSSTKLSGTTTVEGMASIIDPGLRAKVADLCLDYGMQRVQRSAYAGRLARGRADELLLKAKRLAGTRQIDLRLFPICDHDLQQSRSLLQVEPSAGSAPSPRTSEPHASARQTLPIGFVRTTRTDE